MDYYVLDIETTGLEKNKHEITELSIVRCKDLSQMVWLFKVHHPELANKDALFVTKQNLRDIQKRRFYLDDMIDEINAFINEDGLFPNERIFIAHNAKFDRSFVEHYWQKYKKEFPSDYWLCSSEMSKKYIKKKEMPGRVSASLENMLKIANIAENSELKHTAEGDSRTTFMLWKFLQKNGMNNSEFIKLSPSINLYKTSSLKNKDNTSINIKEDLFDYNSDNNSEYDEYDPQNDD